MKNLSFKQYWRSLEAAEKVKLSKASKFHYKHLSSIANGATPSWSTVCELVKADKNITYEMFEEVEEAPK